MINKGLVFSAVLLCALVLFGCQSETPSQFVRLSTSHTGVDFNNVIEDNDTLNILSYEYLYNGGGVAIGDLNGDDLQDIFFSGNVVDNALYINQGALKFKNVTETAGIAKGDRWSSGVTLVDINLDGMLDIYVSATGHDGIEDKSNQLFINQGIDSDGIPTFLDKADDYGLDEAINCTQSAFFDYDNDGDLDLFMIVNKIVKNLSPSTYRPKTTEGTAQTRDRLYRNDWDEDLGHPVYTDVSKDAGILMEGYSLGLSICDINIDGWKDVYITNDYLTNDLLYINNQDGTFSDKAAAYFKHTSFAAMGNDVADLDNDGDAEIVAVDMLPEDNYRRKTMLPPNKYSDYLNNEKYDYQYQYMRNTLQANSGMGADGIPVFEEIGLLSEMAATDWSWTPLVADFDNDGYRDIIVTNGFPKDVTDRDFIAYHSDVGPFASREFLIDKIPSVKIKNYAFRNNQNLGFDNVTTDWGIDEPSFSNGAAYGDLDNDGDLDYVVNNINMSASIYENLNIDNSDWIRIRLNGSENNPLGIGSKVTVYTDSIGMLTNEFTLTRGYLSSVEPYSHFGLGHNVTIDSIKVSWPNGRVSILNEVANNQTIEVNYNESTKTIQNVNSQKNDDYLFSEETADLGIDYVHEEVDYIDFNIQPMMPHKLSQYGPSLAVGDVNSDGLEDVFIGGSHFNKGAFLVQQNGGQYKQEDLIRYEDEDDYKSEELGSVFLDVDGDGDDDLYVVSGGNEFSIADSQYIDRLYINQGGEYIHDKDALPKKLHSGLAIKAADFDQDGDLDLFLGGRVIPDQYPLPTDSYILRNDSKNGQVRFVDATSEIAPDLLAIGMVSDAIWTDFDNDGKVDLIISGEFMPIRFFKNNGKKLIDVSDESGISDQVGWWNSIVAGDFDNDNDIDYIIGNIGRNTVAKISDHHPIRMYYKDFDNNGTGDLFPTCYFLDTEGNMQEYPYFGRLEIAKQYNIIAKRFRFHKELAVTPMDEIFTAEDQEGCLILAANNFSTSYIENKGNGKFEMKPLDISVQRAPIYGMVTDDINHDGSLDVIMVGNDYGMEISQGRLDAHNGLVLYGDGAGDFSMSDHVNTGFHVGGDAKALVMTTVGSKKIVIASQNRGPLKAFTHNYAGDMVVPQRNDNVAIIKLKNGKTRRHEIYYGSSFLSQSSRNIILDDNVQSLTISDYLGNKREMEF